MNKLSFANKMIAIGLLCFAPIALLVYALGTQLRTDLHVYTQERVGVAYTKAVRPLLSDLESYRIGATGPDAAAIAARIDVDLTNLHAFDAGDGQSLGLGKAVDAIDKEWHSHAAPDAILADVVTLLGSISDNSLISLDPVLDGYYVGDTMVNKVPSLIDGVAQADTLGTRVLRSAKIGQDDLTSVAILSGQVSPAIDGISSNVGKASSAAPYLKAELDALVAQQDSASRAFLADIGKLAKHQVKAATYAAQAQTALDAGFALYDAAIGAMDDVMVRRIAAHTQAAERILGAVVLLIVAAALLMIFTTRALSRRLRTVTVALRTIVNEDMAQLAEVANSIAHGELCERAFTGRPQLEANGSDEAAVLSQSYNALVTRLTEVTTDFGSMTAYIGNLIDGVATAAGTLVQIATDMTSAAQEQSERVGQVTLAVSEISSTASQIAKGSEAQSVAVNSAANGVEGLDVSIGQVASLGEDLAAAAKTSAAQSAEGARAVAETADTVVRLRTETSSLETVMTSLEQRSEAVVQIVATIEDIADRTNLLALNAAIEAARAGDHGRGFAVVADEIRKLAERSTQSTHEINEILNGIRKETVGAAHAMRASGQSMDSGLLVARRGSAALDEVARAIEETRRISMQVADATAEMLTTSNALAKNMESVSAVVEQNAAAASELEATSLAVHQTVGGVAQDAARVGVPAGSPNEGIAAETQRIVEVADRLRLNAEDLLSLVDRFRSGTGGGSAAAPSRALALT